MYSVKGLGSILPTSTPEQASAYCSAGRWNWLTSSQCWGKSLDEWQRGALATVAAAPGAPPVALWTVAPADGAAAQATVDDLLNAQLRAQQERNAAGVNSSLGWRLASGVEDAGTAIGDAVKIPLEALTNWKLWALVAIGGAAALVAIGGGSPRRYGR